MTHARFLRCLVPALAALAIVACSSRAQACSVRVPDDFQTIQAAADSLEFYSWVDTIYVSPGVDEDSVYVIAHSELAIVGLGDSLTRPQIRAMRVGGSSYWLVSLINLRLSGEFQTVGKANILFESCGIEGGLRSPIQGSPRELEFRHCTVTSRMWFGSDCLATVDSCRFEGGSVGKDDEGQLSALHCTFVGPSLMAAIEGTGNNARLRVEDVWITGYSYGILDVGDDEFTARSNHIENCGTGISFRNYGGAIVGNTIMSSTNDGLVCTNEDSDLLIERNVVLGSGDRGISIEGFEYTTTRILSNSCVGNHGAGFELLMHPATYTPAAAIVTNNIGYGNQEGLRVSGDLTELQVSCNDWFANDSGAVVGVAPSATDLFVDPQFCDLDQNDVRLMDTSPLVNKSGCGLVGALGIGCANTATLLTLFTAERTADGVRVVWRLANDSWFADVWLERSEPSTDVWVRVGGLESREGDLHVTFDRSVLADRPYWYRLVALEHGRTLVLSESIVVLPTAFALDPITPNPAVGPLRVEFSLAHEAQVDLDVFDVAGRHVTSLVHGTRPAGSHSIELAGARAPGLYLVRYRYPGGEATRRFVRFR